MTKHKGAIIPDPVDPPGTRRVVVCVPDTVEWLSLFTGCVAQMTFGWYWDRSTGDLDAVRNRAKQMYFEMQEQNGLCDVIDCEEVADCIETSIAVQNALNNAFDQWQKGNPMNATALDTNLVPPGCDLDAIYGVCANLVKTMNRQNEDFLEVIEVITNNQEALAYIITAIPFLGDTVPLPELVSIVEKIRDWLAESYRAGYDLDVETEYICDLFCIARLSCSLTPQDVMDYFWGKAQEASGFENAFETALTLTSALGAWTEVAGQTVADVMMASNAGYMSFLNSAFGMTFAQFKLQATTGIPDDDWTTLCDCPDVYCHPFVFVGAAAEGWSPYNVGGFGFGATLTAAGWEDVDNASTGGFNRAVSIKIPMPGAVHLTRISVTFDFEKGAYGVPSEAAFVIEHYKIATGVRTFLQLQPASGTASGDDQVYVWEGDVDLDATDAVGIIVRSSRVFAGSPNGNVLVKEANICGDGDDPFV